MKQRTYKATGINLKSMPMGEADKMVTVLTQEHGIIRAIAPGARKHKSRLAGRSGLFVVNELLFIKGKSIDKLVQAETQQSFPRLSQDLAKLTASQYLAEIALAQALSGQPQEELYCLLIEHLSRLERSPRADVLPCLAQATYHLLALAGVAPEVYRCCLSRLPLTPQLGDPDWQVAFSVSSGGAVDPNEISRLERDRLQEIVHIEREWQAQTAAETEWDDTTSDQVAPGRKTPWQTKLARKVSREVKQNLGIVGYLSGAELALMQQLSKPELIVTRSLIPDDAAPNRAASIDFNPQTDRQSDLKSGTIKPNALRAAEPAPSWNSQRDTGASGPHLMWRHIEQLLRQYAQYQFDRPIKSAALIDTCFTTPTYVARA